MKYTDSELEEFRLYNKEHDPEYPKDFYERALNFNKCIDLLEKNNIKYSVVFHNHGLKSTLAVHKNSEIFIYYIPSRKWRVIGKNKYYYSKDFESFLKKFILK